MYDIRYRIKEDSNGKLRSESVMINTEDIKNRDCCTCEYYYKKRVNKDLLILYCNLTKDIKEVFHGDKFNNHEKANGIVSNCPSYKEVGEISPNSNREKFVNNCLAQWGKCNRCSNEMNSICQKYGMYNLDPQWMFPSDYKSKLVELWDKVPEEEIKYIDRINRQ